MSEKENEISGQCELTPVNCQMQWFPESVASTWPDGCVVLIKRVINQRRTIYEVDNWHRAERIHRKLYGYGKELISIEWAMIDRAGAL
jgi:hypothetical protein